MALRSADTRDSQVDLTSLTHESGGFALSFDAGQERAALMAGTMVADILGERPHLAMGDAPRARLRLHIGDREPRHGGGVPCLVVRPAERSADTTVTLTAAPWAACPALHLPSLGWAAPLEGDPIIDSDRGPICTRTATAWYLNADLPEVYGREVLRHATADGDIRSILASQVVMRAVLDKVLPFRPAGARAASLITVDAEDQQRYFINRDAVCSNIRGAPADDMRFSVSCRTIMDRCEAFGLKAIFMVTGDELDASFTDAFGDPLIGLEDNARVLREMQTRGHGVACHGFDHEWWMTKGRSAIAPMSTWEKLRYFLETSGDVRTLVGLARFLVVHAARLRQARAAKNARSQTSDAPFSYAEVRSDIERWSRLVGFDADRLFIRYPGYVRSAAVVDFLDDRFAATVDSSDLFELDWRIPAFPYSLLAERDGRLRRTRVLEVPCVWIDRLLRTRDQGKVEAELAGLAAMAKFPGSVLSFVTHSKVLGAAWGHCHVYLHDPLRGMALPMVRESWERFARFLAASTESFNWNDLQTALLRQAA